MNFSQVLFYALLVTGAVVLWDRLFAARKRMAEQTGSLNEDGDERAKQSVVVEYARAFFPVILIVFVLRSFVIEPFRIPSGSMLSTLHIGDFILVNKFQYGIRLPIINRKVFPIGEPKRGDVMVFRFPRDPSVNFIKRVIGLPGDRITYRQKQVYINGKLAPQQQVGNFSFESGGMREVKGALINETLGKVVHKIILDPRRPYNPRDLEFTVPQGQYFMMGDNRDYSNDSRYWGFVPEANIVGKAFFIWFSWNYKTSSPDWSRPGISID